MCVITRRAFAGFAVACLVPGVSRAADGSGRFAATAEQMRRQAVSSGDQSYGAVIVRGEDIIGFGPSRVVVEKDQGAHAERVALRDALAKSGATRLPDAVIYSTSIPCGPCQEALAAAGIARMYVGPNARDEGRPRAG
jgi:guanine deaminase